MAKNTTKKIVRAPATQQVRTMKVRIAPATQQVRTMKVRIATARPKSYLMRAAITREQPRRIGKLLPTEYALSNVEVRAKRLKEALRDLRGWRNKNAELAVLSPDLPELFAVIKRTLKKLE